MATADEMAAERIGRAIDDRIAILTRERDTLTGAPARIVEIAAELAALQPEKARIDPRRPAAATPGPGPLIDNPGRPRS